MIDEQQLTSLSHEVDNTLAQWGVKYNIALLSLSAVVNARLLRAATNSNQTEDLRKLLQTIIYTDLSSTKQVKH